MGGCADVVHLYTPIQYDKAITIIISQVTEYREIKPPYNRDYSHDAEFLVTLVVEAPADAKPSGWRTTYPQLREVTVHDGTASRR